uniref:PBPe domain-containing protein n=1 Tax=Heligmosomoides polygyrus TaxID=6339 RepID=A0A8L8JQP6_HELPZ
LKEIIRKINEGASSLPLRRLLPRYTFGAVDCILPTGVFLVRDVLNCICNTIIKNKVALIIFVTASETYDATTSAEQYFLTLAGYTGIPVIAWNADNSGFSFGKDLTPFRIIQMAPPIEHQIRAMIALLRRYSWSKFGVVCSQMSGSADFIKSVRQEIADASNKSARFEIMFHSQLDTSNLTEIDTQLLELKKSQSKIVLLYATAAQARTIFERAEPLGLTSDKYLWIGTQSVRGTQTTSVTGHVQPGMLSINFHTGTEYRLDLLFQCQMLSALFALQQTNQTVPLESTASCRDEDGPPSWNDGMKIYEQMKLASMKGNPFHLDDGHDSFLYTFNKYGKLRNSMLEISNLRKKPEGGLQWAKVGVFTNNELRMADVEWPGDKANPPQGTADKFHVKVVTLHEPPFIIVSDIDPDTGRCPGNQGSIFSPGKLLSPISMIAIQKPRKVGTEDGKETGWNGLIADLISNKADMCVTSLKLNSERARDIDFSLPFLETGIAIIVKIRSGVLSPTAFLEPFEYSTWVVILLVSIQGAAFAIFIFEWVSPYSFNMSRYPPPDHKFSLCRSYWLVWATLFSASVSTDVPKSTVSRCMALVWAAFGLTFLAVYTANLAAFMITRVQFYDLSGINDPLVDMHQPPFRYGTVDGGNTHETMKRNWKKMHEYVQKNKFFRDNISAGVEAVRNEGLDAFVYDAVVLDYWAGKDANCELMMVGKWASMTGYGIGFPKNSPHTALVNQHMLQYQQKGDLERLANFWLTGACSPDSHSQTHSAPLGVENFLSAFFLLGGGIIFSIIVLGCEFFYVRHLRKPLQRIDPKGWCGIISMVTGECRCRRSHIQLQRPTTTNRHHFLLVNFLFNVRFQALFCVHPFLSQLLLTKNTVTHRRL